MNSYFIPLPVLDYDLAKESDMEFDDVAVGEDVRFVDALAVEFTLPPDFGVLQFPREILVQRHRRILDGGIGLEDDRMWPTALV